MALDLARLLADSPLPAGAHRLWLAYSGGVDSSVLLEVMSDFAAKGLIPEIRALHVNHGLQPAADDWSAHCAAHCARLGIVLQVSRVVVNPDDPAGPEAAARRARYTALEAAMSDGDVLVTAHHLDDQAETFLMRSLRGAGPRGLGAMRALQPFGPGWLWRPMLGIERAEILGLARERGLRWVEDPHNLEPRFERSWLRQHLMPLLRQRWPSAAPGLARSARWSSDADELLNELAERDWATARVGPVLSVGAVKALSRARRNNLLRWWLREERHLPSPPHAALEQVDRLLSAAIDAEPALGWPGAELRRYRDGLHGMAPLTDEPTGFEEAWGGVGRLVLPPGCGVIDSDDSRPRRLTVRMPRGGERFRPQRAAHRRTLKNLFQEHAVPPWVRRRTPLLYEHGELQWVGGIGAAAGAEAFFSNVIWHPDQQGDQKNERGETR